MDIAAVRDAIADRFSTIPKLTGLKTVPGQITPPAVLVLLESINFDSTMDGCDEYTFVGLIVVSRTHERVGQDTLFGYLARTGEQSVKAVFEADPTLGGLVEDACVTEVRAPGDTEIGDISYYGVPVVIQVMVAGL